MKKTILILMIFTNQHILFAQTPYYLVDVEQTLSYVDTLFKNHDSKNLKHLVRKDFFKKTNINKFIKYIDNYYINTNSIIEICEKEFLINGNENKPINIIFKKDTTNMWFIDGVNNKNIYKKGFPPLEYLSNFESILSASNDFFGIAPYGTLNKSEITKLNLKLSKKTTYIIKNIIIHNKNRIIDLIYLKFSFLSDDGKGSYGWVLTDFGQMDEFYINDTYYSFIKGTLKLNNNKIQQNKNHFKFNKNVNVNRYEKNKFYNKNINQEIRLYTNSVNNYINSPSKTKLKILKEHKGRLKYYYSIEGLSDEVKKLLKLTIKNVDKKINSWQQKI